MIIYVNLAVSACHIVKEKKEEEDKEEKKEEEWKERKERSERGGAAGGVGRDYRTLGLAALPAVNTSGGHTESQHGSLRG